MAQLHCKTVWQLLKKLNTELPYDPAIPSPSIYPRQLETYVHTKTCTQKFIEAFIHKSKKWKQFKCLYSDEWTKKSVVYSYNKMFSYKKKNIYKSNPIMYKKIKSQPSGIYPKYAS